MPPLPYLARIPGFPLTEARACYADASVWDAFDADLMTLCSPDPQAFRPPDEKVNVLQVSLPTNFKAAAFVSPQHTALLRELEESIEASRYPGRDGPVELPVKLKVHDSVFVPLAKWSMAGLQREQAPAAARPRDARRQRGVSRTACARRHPDRIGTRCIVRVVRSGSDRASATAPRAWRAARGAG